MASAKYELTTINFSDDDELSDDFDDGDLELGARTSQPPRSQRQSFAISSSPATRQQHRRLAPWEMGSYWDRLADKLPTRLKTNRSCLAAIGVAIGLVVIWSVVVACFKTPVVTVPSKSDGGSLGSSNNNGSIVRQPARKLFVVPFHCADLCRRF